MQQMVIAKLLVPFAVLLSVVHCDPNADRFNYDKSDFLADDFGPKDWDLVRCDSADHCVSAASIVLTLGA